MLTPFQRLLYTGLGSKKVLVAASGPCLRTFDCLTGQFISRWSYLDPNTTTGNTSPDRDNEDENFPRKKRKLDNGDVSDSGSAEILIENGSGRQNPRRNAFTVPCITHMIGTTDGKHVVIVTGEDKSVRVLKMTEKGVLHQFSHRVFPKRPSALTLTPDEEQILCSDKFGDVYSVPLLGQTIEQSSDEGKSSKEDPEDDLFKPSATSKTVHTQRNLRVLESQQKMKKAKKTLKAELQFENKLILGHVSLLTDIASARIQTPDGHNRTYILTSDRDEHIRVSRGIPQAHIIENFCLGHEQFVSKLHVPPWRPEILISGGGDGYLLVWNWCTGAILDKLELSSLLPPSQSNLREAPASPISVSGIWSMETMSGNRLIIVSCEKMPGLFVYTLSSNGQPIAGKSIFRSLTHNVLDVAIVQHEQRIIVSLDNVHRSWSAEFVTTQDHNPYLITLQLQKDDTWTELPELISTNTYAQQTRDPLTENVNPAVWSGVFYHLEHLRKKGSSENIEEEP